MLGMLRERSRSRGPPGAGAPSPSRASARRSHGSWSRPTRTSRAALLSRASCPASPRLALRRALGVLSSTDRSFMASLATGSTRSAPPHFGPKDCASSLHIDGELAHSRVAANSPAHRKGPEQKGTRRGMDDAASHVGGRSRLAGPGRPVFQRRLRQ